MMPITIFSRETNAKETSLEVNEDGSVSYHSSNSGWSMLKKGVRPQVVKYTLEEAIARWPSYRAELEAAALKVKGEGL